MTPIRRTTSIVLGAAVIIAIALYSSIRGQYSFENAPTFVPLDTLRVFEQAYEGAAQAELRDILGKNGTVEGIDPLPEYHQGNALPPETEYTRTLVIPRTSGENISWIQEELPDIETAIYTADDTDEPRHAPVNKGHEAMMYITYIIDHYDHLPDIVLFLHAHRHSWHNNDLLGSDAVQMIKALSSARVMREGYMNLRCAWSPGCPAWMHPNEEGQDLNKQEQYMVGKSWSELWPEVPIPDVLAQPCCAQFAVSRDRIRSIPLSRFIHYRDWLFRTALTDYFSGRIWEYSWGFLFTGNNVVCPEEHICNCDGFGVCFGSKERYEEFQELRKKRDKNEDELKQWHEDSEAIQKARTEGDMGKLEKLPAPEIGRDVYLRTHIDAINQEVAERKERAKERGRDPKIRATEAGRPYREGDGF